jgi:hypothetical protein
MLGATGTVRHRAGSYVPIPLGQLAAVRMTMGRWWQTRTPAWRAFALGWWVLLLGAIQVAAFPGSHHILKWAQLLTGLALMLAGVLQLRTGLVLRRRRRIELLRAVATVISALERRRGEESDLDQA